MTITETLPVTAFDGHGTEPSAALQRPVLSMAVSTKIRDCHRERLAVVYVRQSSPQQIVQHRESRERQYALADHAIALGWPRERVLVIDDDTGTTGKTAEHRNGFHRVLAEVTMDHVGLVLGIEMSRIARCNKDWHHLLELCAVFGTILADEDGIYDPNDSNDRLLLGLKGTISEFELVTMRNRLDRGKFNKARRGELFSHAPLGYVRAPSDELSFDPDEQVQAVVRLIFDKFTELGNVHAVLRYLVRHHVRLGVRPHGGADRGVLQWRRPCRATLVNMLRHPIYAGAYCYGRRPCDPRRRVAGRSGTGRVCVSPEQYLVLLPGRCPAYITWERHQENLRRLADNRMRAEARGAPRQGSALLAGILVCGRCGYKMTVSYPNQRAHLRYACDRRTRHWGESVCQSLAGQVLDELVTRQVLTVLSSASLELSLVAAADMEQERQRLDQHWRQRLERARYESQRAARQYHAVEPEHRLVARTLEQRWEQALLEQRRIEEDYDRFRREQPTKLAPQDHELIRSLAANVPGLWNAASTTDLDRKTIVRHLVEKVVVTVQGNTERMDVTIHWAGGFTSRHEVVRPVLVYEKLRDYDKLFARVVELRKEGWTAGEIADQLNADGWRRPRRPGPFNEFDVRQFLARRGLATSRPRDPAADQFLGPHEWWFADLADLIGMSTKTLYNWIRRGWVHARQLRGRQGRWILWADDDELDRLKRLHNRPHGGLNDPPPTSLSTPKPRLEREKSRG